MRAFTFSNIKFVVLRCDKMSLALFGTKFATIQISELDHRGPTAPTHASTQDCHSKFSSQFTDH